MNIANLDLNLLRVFNAIFDERNLIRAGKKLNLSQSATSHALARLRATLQDELFVRTARGMEPTVRALTIAGPIRESMQRIEDTLVAEPFEPGQSEQEFVIAANDYVTLFFLRSLMTTLRETAPRIRLKVRPSTRLDLAEQIDVGRIDLAIGTFARIPQRFRNASLLRQVEVAVMHAGHASRRKLTLDALAALPLLVVSLGGEEEGAVSGFIEERGLARQSDMFDRDALEEALRKLRVSPNYRLIVPHSMVIPDLLDGSDMVAVLPGMIADLFCKTRGLIQRPLPYEARPTILSAVWHKSSDDDPAHAWLRDHVVRIAQQFERPA